MPPAPIDRTKAGPAPVVPVSRARWLWLFRTGGAGRSVEWVGGGRTRPCIASGFLLWLPQCRRGPGRLPSPPPCARRTSVVAPPPQSGVIRLFPRPARFRPPLLALVTLPDGLKVPRVSGADLR